MTEKLSDDERDALVRVIAESYATSGQFPLRPVMAEVERVITAHVAATTKSITSAVQAAVRLVSPDHLTPMGKRQILTALEGTLLLAALDSALREGDDLDPDSHDLDTRQE